MGRATRALLLLLFIWPHVHASDNYTAAVVEYNPRTNYSPNITRKQAQDVMFSNLKEYEVFIAGAKRDGAQIIVFPEYGLYGPGFGTRDDVFPFLEEIPADASKFNICKNATFRDNQPILHHISCLAVSYNMVIVVNMGDVVPCSGNEGCPQDGRRQYNTDVVFSETGGILAKYHKAHLYFEPIFDEPPFPAPTNFTTSFGVTFGILICFDIMFPYPQLYYEKANITNLIYSTWWVNTPPYFSGIQVQLAWSKVTSSNLLASGIGKSSYSSGSGIYSSGAPLRTFYNPTDLPSQQLLVHALPKHPNKEGNHAAQKNEKEIAIGVEGAMGMKKAMGLETATGKAVAATGKKEAERRGEDGIVAAQGIAGGVVGSFLAVAGASGSLSVSQGNLTCSTSYLISNAASGEEYYGLAVLNGIYNGLFYGQICALVKCPSNTTCAEPILNASSVFMRFSLEGNFSGTARLYGSVTTNNMYLAPVSTYETGPGSGPSFVNSTYFGLPLLGASIFGIVWG